MTHSGRRSVLVSVAALSLLPGAQAYCYRDEFGRERCTLSTATRVGIAIATFAVIMIIFGIIRNQRLRAARQQNLAYVNTAAVAGAVPPPAYPPPGGYAPNGYFPQGAPSPYSTPGYAPQYPPQTYSPQPGNVQDYAPPAGPPPGHPPQYYPPPPGPPPSADQKA